MRRMVLLTLASFILIIFRTTDVSAQTVPAWQPNTAYATGTLVSFNTQEFKCLQGHTSQVGWEPPNVPALWQQVAGNPGTQDFSLTVTPASQSVTAGGRATYTVTAAPLNGFTGTVTLSASGLPAGSTASFNPTSIGASGSSTLTVSTATTTTGTFTITVAGASGTLTHTASASLTINATNTADFSLTATPATQSVTVGGAATYTISTAALNGFNGTVALRVSGLPTGATASLNPTSIGTPGSATLTVSTTTATPAGSSALTVTGTSGASSHTAQVSLTVGGVSSGATTGAIHFHLLLGIGNAQDSLTLDGDNYTDLIVSNLIAGVMYGHLIQEYAPIPGIQFNKDYLYGSMIAQLLQENLATQDYKSTTNLIDPAAEQQAVMATGQGGPYQINNYAVDLVAGGTAPAGHSMINYIAIQKNIGFTIATASTQFNQPTPPSFNDKFYGPMLPAFFHYNDFVALNVIGKGPGPFTPPWQPQYDQTLANFVNLPNSFLDVILNVAYNQGYFGGLVSQYSKQGATATAATVATVNAYTSIWGNTSTFAQYPYQAHYYLDQLYNNPIPTTGPTTFVTPGNHVVFNATVLEGVFSNVFQKLAFSNGTSPAQFFSAAQAQTAFNSALAQHGVAGTAALDLSNATDRANTFAVIDSAIGNLESAVGMKFNATTTSQL